MKTATSSDISARDGTAHLGNSSSIIINIHNS